uniref:Uncharacterized protein n=1 Tax=Candidatus Kentrum sp. DK TaxID=2126562 RepID=A0A450S2C8_9GAMM|nr:MAG: hypothetical protein BECKDK2373B_GA0170837_101126 [Candidatus Kentron sp. DK]
MNTRQPIEDNDDMRGEYDFATMEGGVRGKYAKAFEETAIAILLDKDVAEIFPDSRSVNEALRTLTHVLRGENGGACSPRTSNVS